MSDLGELRPFKPKGSKPAAVKHEWYVVCHEAAYIVRAEFCAPHEEEPGHFMFMNDPHQVVWAGFAKTIYLNEHEDVQELEIIKDNKDGK